MKLDCSVQRVSSEFRGFHVGRREVWPFMWDDERLADARVEGFAAKLDTQGARRTPGTGTSTSLLLNLPSPGPSNSPMPRALRRDTGRRLPLET